MRVLYIISDLMYLFVFHFIRYRRQVVIENIRRSFPDKEPEEIRTIAKEFYKRFMDFSVETIKAFTISREELLKRVNFVNVPVVHPFAEGHQSIVLVGSHQFNWEWVLLTGCIVLPFPVDALYQRLRNRSIDDLMVKTRARFGGKPIEKSRILREIAKNPDRLKALGIVGDQCPRRSSPKYWTTFLNQETAFYLGPEHIAKLAKYPVFFFRVSRVKRGHYNVEMVKLAEPPYEKEDHSILEKFARATEKLIREDPPGYLWSHKRWKLKRDR